MRYICFTLLLASSTLLLTMPPPLPQSLRSRYSATERLHHLIEWLRSGERLTTALAAEALDVSRRTVARDLAHLRDVLRLRVQYDSVQASYVLVDGHDALPFLPHPSIVPALVHALPGNPPDEEAEYPPVHLRLSAQAVRVHTARSGHPLAGTPNPDGTLDLHLSVPNMGEFMSWILSCGSEVEVVKPVGLRKRLLVEIQRMLRVYGECAPSAA